MPDLTELQILALRFPKRNRHPPDPVINLPCEEWKQVIDYVYVSNLGRVKKLCHNKKGELIEHLYKLQIYNGHLYSLYPEKIDRKYRKVSRIVLMAFKPLVTYDKLYAMHIDNDPLNCHLTNLKWATLKEILQHQKECGLRRGKQKKSYLIPTIRANGKSGYRRVTVSTRKIAEIKKLHEAGISQSKIADLTGLRQSYIKNIVNGVSRKDG